MNKYFSCVLKWTQGGDQDMVMKTNYSLVLDMEFFFAVIPAKVKLGRTMRSQSLGTNELWSH
jgi:hypothetical protein